MTPKLSFSELLKRAKSERIVVHTPTEKQAITLLKMLDKNGYEWFGGEEITITNYEDDKENTCYVFGIDVDGNVLDKKIMYGSLKFHQKNEDTITEFADIDFKEKKQMIKFEELLERAKTKEIAVHTNTEKQAKTLLKALDEKGYTWYKDQYGSCFKVVKGRYFIIELEEYNQLLKDMFEDK